MLATFCRTVFLIIVVLVSSVAIFWSTRIALADSLSLRDSLADRGAATSLVPGDSRNWQRLARLQQNEGIPAVTSYSRAIEANPRNVDAWIDMGLEQEVNHDVRSAEKALLHAAQISREYVPRWTLLNFYFRRNDPVHFWPWARQALEIGHIDFQPIFRFAWELSGDPDEIDRAMLPDRPYAQGYYLDWLVRSGKIIAAAKVAARLLPNAGLEQVPALDYYCNTELSLGHVAAAKKIWDGMISRHLVEAENEADGVGLVNARFSRDPSNTGFDWLINPVSGVSRRSLFPGLRINFSGKQPESCELLSQYAVLEPNRKYELSYEYETSGIAAGSGLFWRVLDAKTALEFTKNQKNLARERMGWETTPFLTSSTTVGGRLVLVYQRALGTTRVNGWLQIQQVALKFAH